MRPFHRSRGRVVATFEPAEVVLLADLLDQLRATLAERRSEAPVDDLVALTGITVGPQAPPSDRAMARLLPDFVADSELAAGLRELREPGIVAAKDEAAVRTIDTLPRGGGTVRLTDAEAAGWAAAVNDLRLILGTRLDVTEDEEQPASVSADPTGVAAAAFGVYRWLTWMQDCLVEALLER